MKRLWKSLRKNILMHNLRIVQQIHIIQYDFLCFLYSLSNDRITEIWYCFLAPARGWHAPGNNLTSVFHLDRSMSVAWKGGQ